MSNVEVAWTDKDGYMRLSKVAEEELTEHLKALDELGLKYLVVRKHHED